MPSLILGFDYGTRRIGVACGNTLTGTARPLTTLTRGPELPWNDIEQFVAEFAPTQFVVGLPYNMDGSNTALTAEVHAFAAELESRFRRQVVLVDERLSSREARDALRAARAQSHKRRRVTHRDVDMVAAQLLVEQWLRSQTVSEAPIGHHRS